MKKTLIFLILILLLAFVNAQVDQNELESVNYEGVEFRNYQGPHIKIDTLGDIRGIGTFLSRAMDRGREAYFNKYTIIHQLDPLETELFNADILILGDGAGVDHINNLRHILSGYLVSAYNYNSDDAWVLAKFVTFYNAVYRQDMNYFNSHYSKAVLSYLEEGKVGISTSYEEWPGNTQLVIPLSTRTGIDTDILTEEAVIESLREEEGMNLDVRKEMTEIKEEEIQVEEEAIREERQELTEREDEADSRREDIAERDSELTRREEEDSETPELAREREELESEKEELAREEADIAEEREELDEREEAQEGRLEQIREERSQIAEDEEETMRESAAPEQARAEEVIAEAPFLMLSSDESGTGTMAIVKVNSGETSATSPLSTVYGGRYYDFGGGYLVIAGEDSASRIISLVLLDKDSLEITGSATVPVSPLSKLLIEGDSVYAAVRYQGEWNPGRFNSKLELTGIISGSMLPHSNIAVEDDYLVFQDSRARIKSFSLDEMKLP